jgi:hypothetical protein
MSIAMDPPARCRWVFARRPEGVGPVYFTTPSTPAIREQIRLGNLGQLVTPDVSQPPEAGALWAIDNGCYSARWDPDRWSALLERYQHVAGTCLWATVPDVVGDHHATARQWTRWWSAPMRRGYRNAWVAQDGCGFIPAGAGALFIGGTTEWKLGPQARALVELAKSRRMWVHMGRVNSERRYRYAAAIGVDSVDGTLLAHGPDRHLPRVLAWQRAASAPRLFP